MFDLIYNAYLNQHNQYIERLKQILFLSIQYHPFNRLADSDLDDVYINTRQNQLNHGAYTKKIVNGSVVSLLNDFYQTYNDNYLFPTIYLRDGLSFINSDIIYLHNDYISYLSLYCNVLRENLDLFKKVNFIERKPAYTTKLIEVDEIDNYSININRTSTTFQIDNIINASDPLYELKQSDKLQKVYENKPSKMFQYTSKLQFIPNYSIRNNVSLMAELSYLLSNTIRYHHIKISDSNIVKSDIQTILANLPSELELEYKSIELLNNKDLLYPFSIRNNSSINISIDEQFKNYKPYRIIRSGLDLTYILKKTPYSLVLDRIKHQNHFIYEYDFPPVIYFNSVYYYGPLIMALPDYRFVILLKKIDSINKVNFVLMDINPIQFCNDTYNLCLDNYDIKICNINSEIYTDNDMIVIIYEPKIFRQYHNVVITLNGIPLFITFKAFEICIPWTTINSGTGKYFVPTFVEDKEFNFNYNDPFEYLGKKLLPNLVNLTTDPNYYDNYMYFVKNITMKTIVDNYPISNPEDFYIDRRISFGFLS